MRSLKNKEVIMNDKPINPYSLEFLKADDYLRKTFGFIKEGAHEWDLIAKAYAAGLVDSAWHNVKDNPKNLPEAFDKNRSIDVLSDLQEIVYYDFKEEQWRRHSEIGSDYYTDVYAWTNLPECDMFGSTKKLKKWLQDYANEHNGYVGINEIYSPCVHFFKIRPKIKYDEEDGDHFWSCTNIRKSCRKCKHNEECHWMDNEVPENLRRFLHKLNYKELFIADGLK